MKTWFFLFICLMPCRGIAQSWQWGLTSEFSTAPSVGKSYTASTGMTIFSGSYVDSIKVGDTKLVNPGQSGLFISIVNASGEIIRTFTAALSSSHSGARPYVYQMTMDKDDNILMVGVAYYDISFGGVSKNTNGNADFFIAKYSINGDLLWSQLSGTSLNANYEALFDVQTDEEGNIYAAGLFEQGTLTIKDTSVTSQSSNTAILIKYSPEGELIWLRTNEDLSASSNTSIGFGLLLKDHTVYFCGHFLGSFTIEGETILSTGVKEDAFLASLDYDGSLNWIKREGGDGSDWYRDMLIVGDTLVALGTMQGANGTFAGETLQNTSTENVVNDAYLLAGYDRQGNGKWAQVIVLVPSDNTQYSFAEFITMVTDSENNIWLGGAYRGRVMVGGELIETSYSERDMLMMKFNSVTRQAEERVTINTNVDQLVWSLGIDACNSLYVYGPYTQELELGSFMLNNDGQNSLYLARYSPSGSCIVTASSASTVQEEVLIFPNPAHNELFIQWPSTFQEQEASLVVYDALGKAVSEHILDTSAKLQPIILNLTQGLYLVRITGKDVMYSGELIVH